MIKWCDINLGVSPLTNKIFIGKSKPVKDRPGVSAWTDRSGDMTDKVIYAIVDWFLARDKKECKIFIGNKKYLLKLETERDE